MHRTLENNQDKYLENKVDKYYCPQCAKDSVNKELEGLRL